MDTPTQMIEYRTIERLPRFRIGNNGTVWRHVGVNVPDDLRMRLWDHPASWKFVRPHEKRQHGKHTGYLYVRVVDKDGEQSFPLIHRLVLEAFVGPCPVGMQACHADGDRQNNRPGNLRWDTCKANMADKKTHETWDGICRRKGRVPKPHVISMAKVHRTKGDRMSQRHVEALRKDHATGYFTLRELAQKYSLNDKQVWRIVHRVTHREVA
jgi:hypothetical protein